MLHYSGALFFTALACFIWIVLSSNLDSLLPTFVVFYPTIVFIALLIGPGPACVSIVAAFILTTLFIFPKEHPGDAIHISDYVSAFLFISTCTIMSIIIAQYRRVRDNLQKTVDVQTEELRNVNTTLNLAMESAMAGCWEWNIQTNENRWSDGIWKLYGLEPHSVMPSYEAWLSTVHPLDREPASEAVLKAAREGIQLKAEWRVIDSNGNARWLMSRGRPIKNSEGIMERFIGVVFDITDHKHAAEIIAQSKTELEKVVRVRTQELEESREQLHRLYLHNQSLREEERKKFAREIHDELGQMLTALKINLSLAKNESAGDAEEMIKALETNINYIDQGIKTVKRICSALRPDILENLGLTAAIETQCDELIRYGIDCKAKLPDTDIALPQNMDIVLYRIIQETFTNILRHADATQVKLEFSAYNDSVILRISDNGKGVSVEQLNKEHSFGLVGIRERVAALGGSFAIRGVKGRGTTLKIHLPINQNSY